MSDQTIDRFAKTIATEENRRDVVRGLLGVALGGLAAIAGGRAEAQEAAGKKCGKNQHACPRGECCRKGHACCNKKRPEPGRRVCCPKHRKCCGGFNCCPPDTTCDGPTCVG